MALNRIAILSTILLLNFVQINCQRLNTTAQWRAMSDLTIKLTGRNIEFPCNSTKDIYKESGKYIPGNILATRVQMYLYDAILTIPRYKTGVPITLGLAELKCKGCQTTIKPFPNWALQQEGNCEAIQSAVDIYLDRNNLLWVLDDGVVDSIGDPVRKCPPKIICISMITKRIVSTIDLSSYVTPESNVQYIVAETAENGDDYVYVGDAQGAIIMFNARCGKGRRLVLPPSVMTTCNRNCAFYLSIVMKGDYKNYLYFTYIDCPKIFSVETSTLRDDESYGAIKVVGSKPDDFGIVFCGTDNLSNLYFRKRDSNDIYSWDSNTSWRKENWKLVQKSSFDRQVTQVATGPWKLLFVMKSNVYDFVNNVAGYFGASTILRPLIKEVDETSVPVISNKLTRRNRLIYNSL